MNPTPDRMGGSEMPLEDMERLDDNQFAAEWRQRYTYRRTMLIPEITRWMKLVRYIHPKQLADHWRTNTGATHPKLVRSKDLSVEIYNWCRPTIEIYVALLAGAKPMPFGIDLPALDPSSRAELYRADSVGKILNEEMYNQKIPLHFADFCQSVAAFGIGYVYSWIDQDTRRLKTQGIGWPGDVLPEWGSDRYGNGADGMESCILRERLTVDLAERMYPGVEFHASLPDYTLRPDGSLISNTSPLPTVEILKVWYRWMDDGDDNDDEPKSATVVKKHGTTRLVEKPGKNKIGYAEIAYTENTDSQVLYREDDTGYPDIPVRWAARATVPGQPPHTGAGVIDDIIGVNQEYNETMSGLKDILMRQANPRYVAHGFGNGQVPKIVAGFMNMIPLGNSNQKLEQLQDSVDKVGFQTFLDKLEQIMLQSTGISRSFLGSPMSSETSGKALEQAQHSAILRLEIMRTPIQWAWTSLIADIWLPLLREFGEYSIAEPYTNKPKSVSLKSLLDGFRRVEWIWPDVSARDSAAKMQMLMSLNQAGKVSDERVMREAGITSPEDEKVKIREDWQDPILHPERVQQQEMIKAHKAQAAAAQQQQETQPRVILRGTLTPEQELQIAEQGGFSGAPQGGGAGVDATAKLGSAMQQVQLKGAAGKIPPKRPDQNARPVVPQSDVNAAQGLEGGR